MRTLKGQYFATFAVLGCLQPFMPLYFHQRGFSLPQVGWIMAAGSLAVLVTPALVGLLADARVDPRRLMALVCLLASASAAALFQAHAFWPTLLLYTLHCLAFLPATSLEDGMYFRLKVDREERGLPPTPYHYVRVWGTVGFILPSVILFFLLRTGLPVGTVLFLAAICCVLGAVNTWFLPEGCRVKKPAEPRGKGPLPTAEAARIMLEPHVLLFCLGMFLANMAVAAYYTCYPIYLTEHAGISKEWVGLIAMVGVVVEIFFMLGFGKLEARWGFQRLLAAGVACTMVRMLCLAFSVTILTAIGTQALHGMMVLVIQVMPPIYLNRKANDRCRTSMQALYAMGVTGSGRIFGNLAAGPIAQHNLSTVFFCGTGLLVLAGGLFVIAFHERVMGPVAQA